MSGKVGGQVNLQRAAPMGAGIDNVLQPWSPKCSLIPTNRPVLPNRFAPTESALPG
jgi:hypothetical protein